MAEAHVVHLVLCDLEKIGLVLRVGLDRKKEISKVISHEELYSSIMLQQSQQPHPEWNLPAGVIPAVQNPWPLPVGYQVYTEYQVVPAGTAHV